MSGMDGFEPVDEPMVSFRVRCKICREVFPSGIFNVVNHWDQCSGKGFTDLVVNYRKNKGSELNENDLLKLTKIFNEQTNLP